MVQAVESAYWDSPVELAAIEESAVRLVLKSIWLAKALRLGSPAGSIFGPPTHLHSTKALVDLLGSVNGLGIVRGQIVQSRHQPLLKFSSAEWQLREMKENAKT